MDLDTLRTNALQIGNYDLLSKIADGGMGTVYRGRSRITGEDVAIKILSPHLANNTILRRRLEQEYNAARNLDHPNVVRAIDFGTEDDVPYLVMEFVEGESLGQRIERAGALEEAEAIKIIAQVAQALHKAHKQGMIHRDVKPDNVLLMPDGHAKLTDLGLVKEVEADLNLTRTGRGLGTPHFMAPEQFRNAKNADVRCDIYSLGATFYMMVTGQLPFKSSGPVDAWMKKINNDLAAPRELVPAISERIDWAIRRAMSPDPQQRPATCREFLEDLTGHSTRKPNEDDSGDLWYIYYKDDQGEVHTLKGPQSGVRRNLKGGNFGNVHAVRAARTKSGPFEPLRYLPEFRDLVVELAPASSIACTPNSVATVATSSEATIATLRHTIKTMNAKAMDKTTLERPILSILPVLTHNKAAAFDDSTRFFIFMILAMLTGMLGYFLLPLLLKWM